MGIKSHVVDDGVHHFGAIGAVNDIDSPTDGETLADILSSAPVSEENTVSNGGEGPRSA